MNDNLNEQTTIEQETTDGTEQQGFDGTQQPPTFDGTQMPGFGGMHGHHGFGGMQQGGMWGNASFAGEEMLNGNNFAPGNFGAPGELSGIVDATSADISVNIGEQNNFGNFAQGGMMFGNQGGQGMNFRPNNRMQAR